MSNPTSPAMMLQGYASERSGAPSSTLLRRADDRSVATRVASDPRDRRKCQHRSDRIVPPLSDADINRREAIANLPIPFNLAQHPINKIHRFVEAERLSFRKTARRRRDEATQE
jgi:hypothetical protein